MGDDRKVLWGNHIRILIVQKKGKFLRFRIWGLGFRDRGTHVQ